MKPMKICLLAVFVLTGVLAGWSRTLSPSEAIGRVSKSDCRRIGGNVSTAAPRLVHTWSDTEGVPACYAFVMDGMTLFVGADDVSIPLLGYIDSPVVDMSAMPPSMKWWLDGYVSQIAWAAANDKPTYISSSTSAGRTAISPLLSTKWDQSEPYNLLCPEIDGERTVTGCVATAMAQVMNYHKWPSQGQGIASYDWNGVRLSMSLGETVFDWGGMLDSYPTASYGSPEQREAVATLMKACGYSVEMDYDVAAAGGLGALYSNIPGALVNHFDYDKGARFEYRDYYSMDEWESMLYGNLEEGLPVIYGGNSKDGGHSFVCDGYEDGYFHINWGWSGAYDGYFKLDALNPQDTGIGGGSGKYNYRQNAVFGVRRPVPGSIAPAAYIGATGNIDAEADDDRNVAISVDGGAFVNFGDNTSRFTFGLKLVGLSTPDDVSYVASDIVDDEIEPGDGYEAFTVAIPSDLADGSYRAYPVYMVNGGAWESIRTYYYDPSYVALSISSEGVDIETLSVENIDIKNGFESWMQYAFSVEVSSSYSVAQHAVITPSICDLDDDGTFDVVAALAPVEVDVPAYGVVGASFRGRLSKVAAGDYYLVFKDGLGNYIGEPQEIAVTDVGEISGDAIGAEPNPIVAGSESIVQIRLVSTLPTDETISVTAVLCTSAGEHKFAYALQQVTVPSNSSAVLTFKEMVPAALSAGPYRLVFFDQNGYVIMEAKIDVDAPLSVNSVFEDSAEGSDGIYYDLNGFCLPSRPVGGGVYLRKSSDGRVSKVFVM